MTNIKRKDLLTLIENDLAIINSTEGIVNVYINNFKEQYPELSESVLQYLNIKRKISKEIIIPILENDKIDISELFIDDLIEFVKSINHISPFISTVSSSLYSADFGLRVGTIDLDNEIESIKREIDKSSLLFKFIILKCKTLISFNGFENTNEVESLAKHSWLKTFDNIIKENKLGLLNEDDYKELEEKSNQMILSSKLNNKESNPEITLSEIARDGLLK